MFRKLFGKREDKQPDVIQESTLTSGSEEKVACSQCGKMILKRMAVLNNGKCTACTTTRKFDPKLDHVSTPPAVDISPQPADHTRTCSTGINGIYEALRAIDVQQALDLAAEMRISNAADPLPMFLEGAFTYAMRDDAAALNLFRKSMELEPLFAEVPYFMGQLLVETAITDYERMNTGPMTAEMALRWAGTFEEALAAFAKAELVQDRINLASIPDHLSTYKNLLGVDRFTNMPTVTGKLPSEMPAIEDGHTTPEKWLEAIGLEYQKQQFTQREMLVDLAGALASDSSAVFVVGPSPVLSPISMLLSRRKTASVFEVGPRTPDEILQGRLSSNHGRLVILVNQKRVGFGKYFSWLPSNAEVLEIILVNPQSFLSVELLGLLARLQREDENTPVIKFTLATFQ